MNYIFILIIVLAIIYYTLIKSIEEGKIHSLLDDNVESFSKSTHAYVQDLDGLKVEIPIYNKMRIATWEKNTSYDIITKIFGQLLPISSVNTSGSIENIERLRNGEVDFALSQENIAYDCYFGRNEYSNTTFPNIRFVTGLFYEYSILITHDKFPIKTFTDLGKGYDKIHRNYIIGFPEKTSGSFYVGKKLLEVANIQAYDFKTETNNGPNKIYYVNGSTNEIMNLFIQEKIDAIFEITSVDNTYIMNLCKRQTVKFIPIEFPDINILKSYLYPIYYKILNPDVFFTNFAITKEVQTISSRCVLLTRKDVNPIYVELFVKTLFQHSEDINENISNYLYTTKTAYNILINTLMPDKMVFVNKEFPIHRGAKKYYKELGYITEDSNKTCIERFGKSQCNVYTSNFDPIKYYWKYLNLF